MRADPLLNAIRPLLIVGLLALVASPGAGLAADRGLPVTLLDCDFNSETVDAPLPTGGPAAGQPISLGGVDAFVRSTPFGSPSVELQDTWGSGARHVSFTFLNGWAPSTGTMSISADLWFEDADNYSFNLREADAASVSFLSLLFQFNGNIRYGDLDSPGNTLIGTYTTGVPQSLLIDVDLDTATYDLTLNSTALLSGESMGVLPEGIGRIYVGLSHDADSSGTFYLDNLDVSASEVPSPVDASTWGRVKDLFR
ncbi:MAG: hypothetical protein DHS20C21_21700 [Gemmatimonadota bacterium]|nr:MAG: hypothetical protein DHS20C21_21700 [Gemmatimonadota bacterium]